MNIKSVNTPKYPNDIPECVTSFLIDIGISPELKGFKYLSSAITLVANEPDVLEQVTKVLYPSIANAYDTTSSRVERSIRHAIEHAYSNCCPDIMMEYVGKCNYSSGKLTNSAFIGCVSHKLRKYIMKR